MKTLAIIAEYNPFHNGHLYQLNKAREITGADYSVAIMSGNFLQRGELAMWSKYERAAMAIEAGIDLVIELPFVYATGSAGDFATGAVNMLDKLNSIDYLCFGCEDDDLDIYEKIADILTSEPEDFTKLLKNNLKKGLSFAKARALAISEYTGNDSINDIMSKPNNILAIEYITSLKRCSSKIKPVLIKRHIANYHDTVINSSISSATAIRTSLASEKNDLVQIKDDVPALIYEHIKESYGVNAPIYTADIMPYLRQSIISKKTCNCYGKPVADYSNFCDVTTELSNKLSAAGLEKDFDELSGELSSKDYTKTRINRSLLHILMGYTEADRSLFLQNGIAYYANVLGLRKTSSVLLKQIHEASDIAVITKKADFIKKLSEYKSNSSIALTMLSYDLKATELYNALIYDRYKQILPNDFSTVIPVL